MFRDKDIEEIEKVLNSDFENICNWFVDNKLILHFGEDKTKSILFEKNSFLTSELQRMLCSALIQPHFDYACLRGTLTLM